ncbi:MAG: hypothetical protein ACRD5R_03095 [Candidatus Acidiferrales bacterium]
MPQNNRTEGELRFEAYLKAMGYPFEFEKEYPGKTKKPDYSVTLCSAAYLFEVKDADPDVMRPGFFQLDPLPEIIERIKAGQKKFKEFKEFPCCVVMQNNGNISMMVEEPTAVLGAMYGRIGFRIPLYVGDGPPTEPAPPLRQEFTQGAWFQPDRNTRISALITLRKIAVGTRRLRRIQQDNPSMTFDDAHNLAGERFGADYFEELQQGVIVWENVYAKTPLPRDIFNGPYDERYGLDGDDMTRVFCGSAFEEFDQ